MIDIEHARKVIREWREAEGPAVKTGVELAELLQQACIDIEAEVYAYPPTEPFAPDGQTYKQLANRLRLEVVELRQEIQQLEKELQETKRYCEVHHR